MPGAGGGNNCILFCFVYDNQFTSTYPSLFFLAGIPDLNALFSDPELMSAMQVQFVFFFCTILINCVYVILCLKILNAFISLSRTQK